MAQPLNIETNWIFFFSTRIFDYGFNVATWNSFEADHGKGVPDAIGVSIKITADRMVLNGKDIPIAQTLFKMLQTETDTAVKVYYVDSSDTETVSKF